MYKVNLKAILGICVSSVMVSMVSAGCVAPEAHHEPTKSTPSAMAEDAQLLETIENAEKTMRRFGIAEAPAKAPGTFRLTTYNVENLFDDKDDPTLSGRNEDKGNTKPKHQLIAVARAIHKIDSDVICMEEIESLDALLWFRDAYLSDMGYDYVVSLDAGNARGIENAVLSRFPLTNTQQWIGKKLGGVHPELYGTKKNFYAGEPIAFRRSPLKLDVEIPGADGKEPWTLTLFVLHHKSGRYSQYWREAEAKMVDKLAHEIEAEHPGRAIVLLGDFNAQASDESVQIYLRDGFHDIFANATGEPETIMTHESNRRIDLLLANSAAFGYIDEHSAFVLGTAARPKGIDWRALDTFEGYASDHYPVSVDIAR
ncbi:MAG: endonuclease/exonuclease/phosphatase family protein [Phycisphaerales bacterium]